ncbi:gamma-glutamylcyclotransferase family protein [Alkalihalobacillus pseudalcaliphilus]|uniref:gamma-glutamylcyclotransferase family protein n=1 Tax=Alkalihalobacillus pseudalcaliphilus TaxID=79884 RepID=UPI00064DC73D|nr:gamma-glutamylcyclotransferase family protein [Alkalihalobacillus pseudalcaliphilus]KMK75135.1 hypothetical protein AB990_16955 [Alkalihalobacillus pseudalcaliphilus]
MPLYFAYGSCMDVQDIARDVEKARFVGPAKLENYRLAFTKYSKNRQGGVADIVKSEGGSLEGVVFEVPNFIALDYREGAPTFYERINVSVFLYQVKKWLNVSTYTVVHKEATEIKPGDYYASLILNGAKVLTSEYQRHLKKQLESFH